MHWPSRVLIMTTTLSYKPRSTYWYIILCPMMVVDYGIKLVKCDDVENVFNRIHSGCGFSFIFKLASKK